MLDIKELMKLSLEEREVALFKELHTIAVNEHIEKRKSNNGGPELSYLSWAWAFDTIQQLVPINYVIKQFPNENGVLVPYQYDKNTGYMVFTEMTILGITKTMWLPVMDGANKAMKSEPYTYTTKSGSKNVASADMFDVNKTIMRCLVKNLSLFGLGLYIYAGEDLPPVEKEYITKEQYDEMIKLGVKINKVLESYGIQDIKWLEKSEADYVINAKKQYLEKQKAGATNGNTTK